MLQMRRDRGECGGQVGAQVLHRADDADREASGNEAVFQRGDRPAVATQAL